MEVTVKPQLIAGLQLEEPLVTDVVNVSEESVMIADKVTGELEFVRFAVAGDLFVIVGFWLRYTVQDLSAGVKGSLALVLSVSLISTV